MDHLSSSATALLAEVAATRAPQLASVLQEPLARGALSHEETQFLRDAVGEELFQAGFDADYMPTARGQALEDLIDDLARIDPDF
jgi:hypothetical protein